MGWNPEVPNPSSPYPPSDVNQVIASVNAPGAGATIVSVPAASLPAGWYNIFVSSVSGNELNNTQLQCGTLVMYMQDGSSATVITINDSPGFSSGANGPFRVYLDGLTPVTVTAIVIGTGTYTVVLAVDAVGTPATQDIPPAPQQ